jgi:adenosylcobyric acid synthase
MAQLEARCGVPTVGVLPFVPGLVLDAEDSLHRMGTLEHQPLGPGVEQLDVAVLRLPRLSNFTDFDPLLVERGVAVRFVDHPSALGDPDLVVLPGTKSTVADLEWVRTSGLRRLPDAGPHHRGSGRSRVSAALGARIGVAAAGHPVRGGQDHPRAPGFGAGRVSGAGL